MYTFLLDSFSGIKFYTLIYAKFYFHEFSNENIINLIRNTPWTMSISFKQERTL